MVVNIDFTEFIRNEIIYWKFPIAALTESLNKFAVNKN